MDRYDLTDFEGRVIEPLLPNKTRGVPRADDRRVLNGILWVLRTGARFLPAAGAPGDSHLWPAVATAAGSLLPVAPCGLPLALGCRRLWRLRYRRAAWTAGIGLGVVSVAASLVAGLLGPVVDRRPCGRTQSAGMGSLVVAGAASLITADVGPAAQQDGRSAQGRSRNGK